ncbi:MAG: efflux RND transporter permease subunit [Marvinbryantia sp.]|uniref:efflux RND transporter permease subunit n=1 Tax=Marvinbryantia sp. TaxID=2496532 RepID=UPI0025EA1E48|nr:MMPL family transporter [uncultured Marvinbryantia sp.]
MKKFYTGVVKCRKAILVLFIAAAIAGLFLSRLVSVNYDITDYLPPDSPSTVALDVMGEEFDGGIPNARVMIRDVSVVQALEYKEKLKQIDGVQEVTWLDDVVDVREPLEMQETDTVEAYYKDDTALFTVTVEEEKRLEAVEAMRELVGENGALTGNAVSTATATTDTVVEISRIVVVAVLFVLLVLILTTNSWVEPLIVLGGLGVAILINNGSNLIFGEISFVTNAAGSILQLAVSLDYSVFLIHRFEECRQTNPDVEEAMVDALCKSTGSILSSGLTTVIGFVALCLMRFLLGPDLGLALAKGVALSLVTVFIFMPALILSLHKLMDKTRHKDFMPSFRGFGRLVQKMMLPLVCVFLVLVVPSYLASNSNSYYYGSSHMFNEETRMGKDIAQVEAVFGQSDSYVLLVPTGQTAVEKELSDELHTLPEITGIISYVDMAGSEIPTEFLDADTLAQLQSDNYSRMVLSVDADYEGEETFRLVEQIREIAEKYYPGTYYLAGEGVSSYDLMNTVTADMVKVNAIAIGAVLVVLLILQKSIVLPVILVLCIETAIWINLSIPYFAGDIVFYIAYLIISSIQLGATVDYAILFSDRYREARVTHSKKDAIVETISAVMVSVLTSGSVLTVVGFLLGKMSSNGLLAQLGMFLGVGAICSLVIVLFVLPGFLYLLDGLFMKKGAKEHKSRAHAKKHDVQAG